MWYDTSAEGGATSQTSLLSLDTWYDHDIGMSGTMMVTLPKGQYKPLSEIFTDIEKLPTCKEYGLELKMDRIQSFRENKVLVIDYTSWRQATTEQLLASFHRDNLCSAPECWRDDSESAAEVVKENWYNPVLSGQAITTPALVSITTHPKDKNINTGTMTLRIPPNLAQGWQERLKTAVPLLVIGEAYIASDSSSPYAEVSFEYPSTLKLSDVIRKLCEVGYAGAYSDWRAMGGPSPSAQAQRT